MKGEFSRRILEKYSNIKFHENLSSGSQIVPWGHKDTRTQGQTDMTKVIIAVRNFAKEPKNRSTEITSGDDTRYGRW